MDRDATLEQLDLLIAQLAHAQSELAGEIRNALHRGEQLREAVRDVGASSSGSWIGWHSRMYYGNYEEPAVAETWDSEWGGIHGFSDLWRERSLAEVQEESERRAGVSLADLGTAADRVRESCEPLQRETLTVLSPICDLAGLEKEAAMLSQIEKIKWIVSPGNFIRAIQPGQMMSRDSQAISQGMQVPLHINVESALVSNTSTIATCRDFLNDALRIARQARTKVAATPELAIASLPSDATETTELRRQLRYLSIALFVLLSLAVIAGLVALLRLVDLGTLLQAAVVVGGAVLVAGLYALFIDRRHALRALGVASGAAGAIAAVDQLLAALK